MSATQTYKRMLGRLKKEDQELFHFLGHGRVETCFVDRVFLIYHMVNEKPVVIDRVIVTGFSTDTQRGAHMGIKSVLSGNTIGIGYGPVKLWDYPIFLSIPMYHKVGWAVAESDADSLRGSLSWQVYILTEDRMHMRQPRVTYMETGPEFGREFNDAQE